MGGTLSCDACKRVINTDDPHTSEHVYTLKKEKDEHICVGCYDAAPSLYASHIKELGFDIVDAAHQANMEKLGPSIEKAAKHWDKYEYSKPCSKCGAETAMHPGTVACFYCKKPFESCQS